MNLRTLSPRTLVAPRRGGGASLSLWADYGTHRWCSALNPARIQLLQGGGGGGDGGRRKHLSADCFFVRLINSINPPPCLSAVIKVNPAASIHCCEISRHQPRSHRCVQISGLQVQTSSTLCFLQQTIFKSIMFLHKHVVMETDEVLPQKINTKFDMFAVGCAAAAM